MLFESAQPQRQSRGQALKHIRMTSRVWDECGVSLPNSKGRSALLEETAAALKSSLMVLRLYS